MNRTSLLKFADQTVGSLLCRVLGVLHYLLRREDPSAPVSLEKIRRVLVIRPGGMGDMILLLPTLRLLMERMPSADVQIACESRNVEVLRIAGLDRKTMVCDVRPFSFLARLFARRYDLAIDTEQFHNFSSVLALLSRAPVRIGFNINPRRNPLYTHLVPYSPDGREDGQFLRLLRPLGLDGGAPGVAGILSDFSWPLPPAVRAGLDSIDGRFAAIHADSTTPHKQWPADRFRTLADQVRKEFGLPAVWVGAQRSGGRDEGAGASELRFSGRLSLPETAQTVRAAKLFIGTDSGLAHLAVALGVPTVVLFGPSDSGKWGMEDGRHAVVSRPLPCAPCFIFGYHKPCRSRACMSGIRVEDVLTACRKVLAGERTDPPPQQKRG